MLQISELNKQYRAGRPIFKNFSAEFKPGSAVAVVGPNGSGKTTFLRILSVNSFPTSGTVTYNGLNIHDEPAAYLAHVAWYMMRKIFRNISQQQNCWSG
jgi:ABC-type multidrug transport system ATPase subunit